MFSLHVYSHVITTTGGVRSPAKSPGFPLAAQCGSAHRYVFIWQRINEAQDHATIS